MRLSSLEMIIDAAARMTCFPQLPGFLTSFDWMWTSFAYFTTERARVHRVATSVLSIHSLITFIPVSLLLLLLPSLMMPFALKQSRIISQIWKNVARAKKKWLESVRASTALFGYTCTCSVVIRDTRTSKFRVPEIVAIVFFIVWKTNFFVFSLLNILWVVKQDIL